MVKGYNESLYIPIGPIIKVLGGTVKTDAARHWFSFNAPLIK
jgi:hypothetical protein